MSVAKVVFGTVASTQIANLAEKFKDVAAIGPFAAALEKVAKVNAALTGFTGKGIAGHAQELGVMDRITDSLRGHAERHADVIAKIGDHMGKVSDVVSEKAPKGVEVAKQLMEQVKGFIPDGMQEAGRDALAQATGVIKDVLSKGGRNA